MHIVTRVTKSELKFDTVFALQANNWFVRDKTRRKLSSMLQKQDTANLLKYCVIMAATLPMMLLYFCLQKYFEKGDMIGSVKA